jgi:hypothetical protein
MWAHPVEDFRELNTIPGDQRKNEEAVRSVRARIHELNGATVLLYTTAVYLGYSQRVRRELTHSQLQAPRERPQEVKRLIETVRSELNGPGGAGMIDDLQDLIGESIWIGDDAVISYYEFRERILSATGWELYTELFRFFCHFHKKLDYEVKKTREALAALCDALG